MPTIYKKRNQLKSKADEIFKKYHNELGYGYFRAKELACVYCQVMFEKEDASLGIKFDWETVKFYIKSTSYGE